LLFVIYIGELAYIAPPLLLEEYPVSLRAILFIKKSQLKERYPGGAALS